MASSIQGHGPMGQIPITPISPQSTDLAQQILDSLIHKLNATPPQTTLEEVKLFLLFDPDIKSLISSHLVKTQVVEDIDFSKAERALGILAKILIVDPDVSSVLLDLQDLKDTISQFTQFEPFPPH